MKIAFIDTSYLLAVAFGEPIAAKCLKELRSFDRILACGLLEAEILSAFKRERIDLAEAEDLFESLDWVFPDKRLGAQLKKILGRVYLRGADAHHLSCALWALEGEVSKCHFLSLDANQKRVAKTLGFLVSQ
jgi:predicted nucleic acid-binding protein